MWPEALALTQRHLPHKLSEVSVAYSQAQAQQGTGGSKADFLNAGRMWEQQKQWSQAIDAYLNATREVLPNPDDLVEVLDCAVTVARRNCPKRYQETVAEAFAVIGLPAATPLQPLLACGDDELVLSNVCLVTAAEVKPEGFEVLTETPCGQRAALSTSSPAVSLMRRGITMVTLPISCPR